MLFRYFLFITIIAFVKTQTQGNKPRVELRIQLLAYQNKNRWLPNGYQCYYGQTANPSQLRSPSEYRAQHQQRMKQQQQNAANARQPQQQSTWYNNHGFNKRSLQRRSPKRKRSLNIHENDCQFFFTTILTSPSDTVQTVTGTNSIPLSTSGYANLSNVVTAWESQKSFLFQEKPVSITILVHHFGNIQKQGGTGADLTQGLALVNEFQIQLTSVVPAAFDGSDLSFVGQNTITSSDSLRSSLSLVYGLRCLSNSEVGPFCDLKCDPLPGTNQVSCNSTLGNGVSVCTALNGSSIGQVGDCQVCQYGRGANGFCSSDPLAAQLAAASSSKVGVGYYIATICLGVLLGLTLIIMLLGVLWYLFFADEEDDGFSNTKRTFRRESPAPLNIPTRIVERQPETKTEWGRPFGPGAPMAGHESMSERASNTSHDSNSQVIRMGNGRNTPRREAQV